MNKAIPITLAALSTPLIVVFLLLAPAVILFALPSAFGSGNPLNLIFVAWWCIGGFGLYSGFKLILSLNSATHPITQRDRIGSILGIIVFVPIPMFCWDLSWLIRGILYASLIPIIYGLYYSRDREKPNQRVDLTR